MLPLALVFLDGSLLRRKFMSEMNEDEMHGSDKNIFVWDGGFLKSLDKLSEASLKNAKQLFDSRYEKQMEKMEHQTA